MLINHEQDAFGKKLVEAGAVTSEQLAEATLKAASAGVSLEHHLVQAGLVPKSKVYEALAEIYSVPYVDVSNFQISQETVHLIPGNLAHRYKVIPLFKIGNSLNIAMQNPLDVAAIDHLAQKTRCDMDVCLGAADDIESALMTYYGAGNSVSQLLESLAKERAHRLNPEPNKFQSRAVPAKIARSAESRGHAVIELVNLIIRQAYEEGASDIHIEPEEKMLRVRYRVDGVLHAASVPAKELESEIITRIKVLAEMDIAESRIPQDGRIKMNIHGKDVEMRISAMPTLHGENIVIRILKDDNAVLDLESLGMSEAMRKVFKELIRKPYGMILETGPTGSGKTTTLYAALNLINSIERNIVTIEDPVEYKLPLIRQIPVNLKAGLSFANALRSILRQDPDVIMVGEIRDRETAEIAVQSALTGHLVFSTLHANSAAGVVTRLVDMKIEPFLVASSVVGIISQRLIRRICEKCKEEDKSSDLLLTALKVESKNFKAFKGKGCRHCQKTGYKGRIGIFEILVMNEAIQKRILANGGTHDIEREARQSGMKSLREDAFEKIQAGLTSAEEAMKAIDIGSL